jgi:hypothetical protein
MPINDLLDRLEDAERRFVGAEFLAPLIGRGPVAVRIAGLVCHLRVTAGLPRSFRGWAILRSRAINRAEFVRPATLSEIAAYLDLFPAVRLILAHPVEHRTTLAADSSADKETATRAGWLAFPAHGGDQRIQIKGPAQVWLAEEGLERFETIIARCDGRLFWYERRSPARDPAIAAYLREQLALKDDKNLPPEPAALHKPGLSHQERQAYGWVRALLEQAQRDAVEVRLSEALAHSGAALRAYAPRADAYVVTYEIDGRQHISTVQRDDLTVMTAGICLSGQDRRFDLTSLVGVLRQAAGDRQLVRVGEDGLDETAYWQTHPPESSDG